MDERWIALSQHFDKKVSKVSKKERSELLKNLKRKLGLKAEPVELLT